MTSTNFSNLTDVLTPVEISVAEALLREKLTRIEDERMAEIAAVNERYDLLQRQAKREVVLSVMGSSEVPAALPAPREGFTVREIAQALRVHKDSVANWKKAGLLPDPVPGTGGNGHNPLRYVVNLEDLQKTVRERNEAAQAQNRAHLLSVRTGRGQVNKAPTPTPKDEEVEEAPAPFVPRPGGATRDLVGIPLRPSSDSPMRSLPT